MKYLSLLLICTTMSAINCSGPQVKSAKNNEIMNTDSSSGYLNTVSFLKKHTRIIELKRGKSAVALAPDWQGRIMTSSQDVDNGFSFGWVNKKLIESGKLLQHINAFGGEERLWLGPEGGQFSIYFPAGKEFVYDNWQVPAFLDTAPWDIISSSDTAASFKTALSLKNYSGTSFDFRIDRTVSILDNSQLVSATGVDAQGLDWVAYKSVNTITNTGKAAWKKETGLLSIWMLGMFTPSPSVVVVVPFKEGDEKSLGLKVNDNYFGKIAGDRLKVSGSHIFFRADGKSRGKIGIPPLRTAGVMGSFDSEQNILTLLVCKLPEGITDYVNSAWEIQKNPYSGDAFNSYNDGPLADGSQMGPFYELETSSPALSPQPGESMTHSQVTIHLTGNRELLEKVAWKTLGVSLNEISGAFK